MTIPDDDEPGKTTGPTTDSRLKSLESRLGKAHRQEAERTGRHRVQAKGQTQGMRVMSELIGAPLGGAIVGWLLDRWFHTKPWLLLVMLLLGFAVAVRNIIRISKQRPE